MTGARLTLAMPLSAVKGVGPKAAEALAGLGVANVGQLVAHLPFKHERQEAETEISGLVAGRVVSARGTVTATRVAGSATGRGARFEAVLCDDDARLDLVWFNGAFLRGKVHPGDRLRVQGKAVSYRGGLRIANPKFEVLSPTGEEPGLRDERLRPVYPASEGVSSTQIEKVVGKVLEGALPLIEDHFSEEYRRARELPPLAEAYRLMHRPEDPTQVAAARRRLAYDELFLLQLGLALKRREREAGVRAPVLRRTAVVDARVRARLPFALTPGQEKVVEEVATDLGSARPANRLIQGDVGSGKTVVALYAMLLAVAGGHQAALMAPTELLAEQHAGTIRAMLFGSRVRVTLLTGSLSSAERREEEGAVREGRAGIVVGTHALLTEGVGFKSLAVAVIDEQHRFGVHQRAGLTAKARGGFVPHVLVMTATPIPRTLAMTLFGDLDVSTIEGLPPGRKPVKTRVVDPAVAGEVYAWVRTRLELGEQAFIVAPAIDPVEGIGGPGGAGVGGGAGELGTVASVVALVERLRAGELHGKRLEVLHGQMPAPEREATMKRFRAGEIDALVATTIVEVGVDVPNATVMVVEQAERFGLAQLHQLRGRVGRGGKGGACILIGKPMTPDAEARLAALAASGDGFALAERDLEIRGFGDLLGVRQSGMPPFKVADLTRDLDLLTLARRDAAAVAAEDPLLAMSGRGLLKRRLLKAHGGWLELGGVG